MTSSPGTFGYKAFISYSHAADGKLAPALQTGLERFAKPWHRLRAFRVFRDKTGLSVTPALWGSIQRALESSEYFILLASPAAAQSNWVQQEVKFWLQHRSTDKLLIVLTDGAIAWDSTANDFDWTRTDALPRLLERRFGEEPNYLDLGWARQDTDLSLRRPRFLDAIASLAATLRHVPLDDLIGEDVAHHRTTRRLLQAGVALLLSLTAFAFYTAYVANRAARVAQGLEAERDSKLASDRRAADERAKQAEAERVASLERGRAAATSRRLASAALDALPKDRELSTLLAIEAVQISPTPEAENALRQALIRSVPPISLRGPRRMVTRVAFGRSGGRLLAVFEDGSIRIWKTSEPPVALDASAVVYPNADGASAALSPDGSMVLTSPYRSLRTFLEPEGNGAAARLWDAATGRLVWELKHPYVQHAAFSPDGRRVVTAGDDQRVVIWDVASGARIAELEDHEGRVVHVEFSADGRWFATAGRDGTDDTVRIRSAADGKPAATLHVPGKTLLTAASFSPDGRWILTMNQDDPPRLWEWQRVSGSSAFELPGQTGSIYPVSFSPDSTWLVTAGYGDTARVWEVSTGRNLHVLKHEDFVSDASFSADARWIVTTSVDRSAILWEAASGSRLMELGGPDRARTAVAFSPDGARVATGTADGEVLLYACEICGSASDLLALARSRVTRALTAAERTRYLGG